MNAVIAHYLHFLGFALLFAFLAVELTLFKPTMTAESARKLARIDIMYGLSALLVLVTGLLKMMSFGKGPEYYGHNFIFHIKLTLVVVIFLLSVFPTFRFIKARDGDPIVFPPVIGVLLKVQMAMLVAVPLLGVLMARGYGYTG